MNTATKREIYFSFFMFTADLRPEEAERWLKGDETSYTRILIDHLKALASMDYDGFDLHIAPRAASVKHPLEVDSYRRLKQAFNNAGLENKKFATNVGTTQFFDPTSPYKGIPTL